ncbi:MAG TPA: condensation domain-containing protein, partial [Myxococcales bacterium]|nr:condensation domain-containing protein [Myxococcales bacterium]
MPLSFAQQRLWFLDQLEPNNPLYNVPVALRLSGALDVPALEKSLGELIRRHEALRTTFRVERGQPVQVISPGSSVHLQVVPATEEEARRLASEEAQKPFDLANGPLVRGSLLRLAEREHVLLLAMHQIVSDDWSIGVLIRELAALYQASPLPELRFQYADYAAWQRRWLQGEVLQTQLSYWKQQLKGAPQALELPTDKPRPAVQTFRGARHAFALPRELSEALKGLSRREHVTDFMVL